MLREKLIQKQNELGASDRDFAQLLGVPRTTWVLTRTGRKPVRGRIARAALRTFPDLAAEALSLLLTDVRSGTDGVPKSTQSDEALDQTAFDAPSIARQERH